MNHLWTELQRRKYDMPSRVDEKKQTEEMDYVYLFIPKGILKHCVKNFTCILYTIIMYLIRIKQSYNMLP